MICSLRGIQKIIGPSLAPSEQQSQTEMGTVCHNRNK